MVEVPWWCLRSVVGRCRDGTHISRRSERPTCVVVNALRECTWAGFGWLYMIMVEVPWWCLHSVVGRCCDGTLITYILLRHFSCALANSGDCCICLIVLGAWKNFNCAHSASCLTGSSFLPFFTCGVMSVPPELHLLCYWHGCAGKGRLRRSMIATFVRTRMFLPQKPTRWIQSHTLSGHVRDSIATGNLNLLGLVSAMEASANTVRPVKTSRM